ncbi:MAG: aldehyde dehydrogenase family protein [Armatimonadota bacterium]|nr:aldehyde dehydrogenase family protein [Armatimonadota bacterium]
MLKDKDRYLMLVGGEWRIPKPEGEAGHENRNPATGELIGVVPEATGEEVSQAVKIAANAFLQWRQVPTDIKMKFGLRLADLLEEQREKLVRTIAREMGKTRFDAHLDINEAVGVAQVVSTMAVSMTGKAYTNIVANLTMESRVEPRGVVALITPFNFPIAIPTAHIVAALVTGNTVVWKPAPEVPECSQALASLILRAMEETERRCKVRFPRGIFNMIFGDADAGEALISQPAVQTVSFTGSKAVGDRVDSIASGLGKKVIKEVGGINQHYIDEAADLSNAAIQVLYAKTITNGQRCTSVQEALVHERVYDAFVQELMTMAQNVVMGDPLSEEVWQANNAPDRFGLGPLVSIKQKLRAEDLLNMELNDGATLLYQGEVPENLRSGYFFPLTIIESQKLDDTLSREEIFAPVLVLRKVSGIHEAIEIINEKRIGIVACIHTRDMNAAEFFIQQVLRTRVDVNRHGTGALWGTKFGGDRGSGSGNPSLDCEMVYNYVLWKTVYRAYSPF